MHKCVSQYVVRDVWEMFGTDMPTFRTKSIVSAQPSDVSFRDS